MNALKRFHAVCYAIEGINSFAVVIYFSYLYFFFRDRYGFSDRQNLLLAALMGLVYTFSSWQAGRFAQRYGHFVALKTGFSVMIAGLVVASQLHSAAGIIAVSCVTNSGMCFIWPTIEALVSEGETSAHVPHAVGLYNITWAAANALAFFVGGTLLQKLGYQSIFYVPLGFMVLQLGMVFWLEETRPRSASLAPVKGIAPDPNRPSPARAKNFQRMAWLANPFAYVAINTLLAVLPGIAAKFHLSTMLAGFVCSLWCFVRLGAFIVLWRWTGWHYRFRWMVAAFALLIVSFAGILVAPTLALLLTAQVFFGIAIGLIYYSSLFYAMDASETKSEHGGIHEAAIGVGNCVGPAIGAAALWFAPGSANAGAWAVSGLLAAGFGGLLWLRQPR